MRRRRQSALVQFAQGALLLMGLIALILLNT